MVWHRYNQEYDLKLYYISITVRRNCAFQCDKRANCLDSIYLFLSVFRFIICMFFAIVTLRFFSYLLSFSISCLSFRLIFISFQFLKISTPSMPVFPVRGANAITEQIVVLDDRGDALNALLINALDCCAENEQPVDLMVCRSEEL